MDFYGYRQFPARYETIGKTLTFQTESHKQFNISARWTGDINEHTSAENPQIDRFSPDQAVEDLQGSGEQAQTEATAQAKPEVVDMDVMLAALHNNADRRAEAFLADWMRRFSRI